MLPNPNSLTVEQQGVVELGRSQVTVTAAAGSGKTRVLVERYLRHVCNEGISPEQILTITFTRKAAAEMKGRIVDELRKRNQLEWAQRAETGPIQTIHSFCERLLREHAIDANIDAGFEILAMAHTSRLVAESVRHAFTGSLEDYPAAEALIAKLAGKRRFKGPSPYSVLEDAVSMALQEFRGGGILPSDLESLAFSKQKLEAHAIEHILASLPVDVRTQVSTATLAEVGAELKSMLKGAKAKVPTWLTKTTTLEEEGASLDSICGVLQLTLAAWAYLSRSMSVSQGFDFNELEIRAVRLLQDSESVRRRVRAQFQVMMLDEAQDLNPVQDRLLKLVGLNQTFVVGDAQQSIYGFRYADVELFKERLKSEPSRLSKNHRSVPGILRFVDRVFEEVWKDEYVPMNTKADRFDLDRIGDEDYTGVEIWEHPDKTSAATAVYVKQLLDEGCQRQDIAILVRKSAEATRQLDALQRQGVPAKIAGSSERFYTRMEVRDMANALRACADPYDDFALLATLRSPIVGLSLDSVVSLGLESPVVENLATFAPLEPDDQGKMVRFISWFDSVRRYADRLSAWEVINEIFAKTEYLNTLALRQTAPQLLANVRKLLALASSDPELGPLEFADQIREIQDLSHREGEAPSIGEQLDQVTIMTIHKSKGLEFPIVVVPQTNDKLAAKKKPVVCDPTKMLLATNFDGDNLLHKFLTEAKKDKEREEEWRVLYVAMTRAKKRLCVDLYPKKNEETLSKRIREIVGDPAPESIRVRTTLPPT